MNILSEKQEVLIALSQNLKRCKTIRIGGENIKERGRKEHDY